MGGEAGGRSEGGREEREKKKIIEKTQQIFEDRLHAWALSTLNQAYTLHSDQPV